MAPAPSFSAGDVRKCRSDGGHPRTVIVYGCRDIRVRALQNDRPYRIGTLGTSHMNFGVRCRNRGVPAGLYSQPRFVMGTESKGIVDERSVRGQSGVGFWRKTGPRCSQG